MAHILIYEDNLEYATELVDACLAEGYVPHEASDLAMLKQIIARVHCHVALIDINVPERGRPGANGVKAIGAIRRNMLKKDQVTKIVIISGSIIFRKNMEFGRHEVLAKKLRADGLILKRQSAKAVMEILSADYITDLAD